MRFCNQLASAGIKAKAYLAEGLGYGTSDEGMMKLAKDLEKGAIGANQAIELILEGMKEFDGMMDRTANETVEGLKSQLADVFEINIMRKWGQGLQDGAKRGLGSIVSLLDDAKEGLSNVGDMLYDIGKTGSNWVADRLEGSVEMITALAQTDQFKEAGIGGKIKILWDGVVADPIKEWWEKGGRTKASQTAQNVGTWLGSTLQKGLLAIFGMTDILNEEDNLKDNLDNNLSEDKAEEKGRGIAQSFAKGFADNFDVSVITDKFLEAIKNIWNALPTWAKWALGIYGGSKATIGISNLVGGIGTLAGATRGFIGSPGTMMVAGSGLLGKLAGKGYDLAGTPASAYFPSGHTSVSNGGVVSTVAAPAMGTGKALLTGLGHYVGVGGLAVGAGTAISGIIDMVQGRKKDDSTKFAGGSAKVVGAGSGASLGAFIGSMIAPGLGTLVGGGIGALAGSVAGWWGASKIKQEAAEEAAKKGTKALEELAQSESDAAEEAAKLLIANEKLAKESLAKHFGDVTLSAEEMQKAIINLNGTKELIKGTEAATAAIDEMNAAYSSFTAQDNSLKKTFWMSYINDGELSADDKTALKKSTESFGSSAQSYVKDAQFAATESITAIMGNSDKAKKLIESTNDYYGNQGDELARLSKDLNDQLSDALGDNVISLKEKESLDKIRSQISNIVRKIQDEEYEAEMNILKFKFAGDLTPEGFNELMQGSVAQNKTIEDSLYEEYGRASRGKSDDQIEELRWGMNEQRAGMWEKTGDLGLESLRDLYEKELGILGQDIGEMLKKNTPDAIMKAVEGMDGDTRPAIAKMMEYLQPTTDEIAKLVKAYEDAGKKPPEALSNYMQSAEFYTALGAGKEAVEQYFRDWEIDIDAKINADEMLISNLNLGKKVFAVEANVKADWTYDEFDEEWISPDKQYSFTAEALVAMGWTYNEFRHSWISPDERYSFHTDGNVDVNWLVDKFGDKVLNEGGPAVFGVGGSYGAYPTTTSVMVNWQVSKFRPSYSTFGLDPNGYSFRIPLNVTAVPGVSYTASVAEKLLAGATGGSARGDIWYPAGVHAKGFATGGIIGQPDDIFDSYTEKNRFNTRFSASEGGMVRGGTQLIKVAEEGTPEMIIPLGIHRRDRALKLWNKAGEMLDVPGFARGGIAGESNNYKELPKFQIFQNDEEDIKTPKKVSGGINGIQTIQVDIGGVQVEFNIDAGDTQDVAEVIRAQADDIAETVAGVLAAKLKSQFENTPIRKGGAA